MQGPAQGPKGPSKHSWKLRQRITAYARSSRSEFSTSTQYPPRWVGAWVPPGHTKPSWQGTQRPPFRALPPGCWKLRKLPSRHSQSSSEVAPWNGVVSRGSGQAVHSETPEDAEKVPRGQRK